MSLENNYVHDLANEKIYHDFCFNFLEHIFNQIIQCAQEEDVLLLIDDYASEVKIGAILTLLNSPVTHRRHLRLPVWMSVQTFLKEHSIESSQTINILIFLNFTSKAEVKVLWEEMTFLSKDVFDLLKYVFQKSFDYLVLDSDKTNIHANGIKLKYIVKKLPKTNQK